MQLAPLAQEPLVGRAGAGVEEHPAVARDAEALGRLHRAEHERRRLVDLDVRVQQLGIGERHAPVARRRRRDLLGRVGVRRPRGRLVRGHGAEARPQARDQRELLRARPPGGDAQRLLDQGIGHDRRDHPDGGLGIGSGRAVVLEDLAGLTRAVGRGPRRLLAGLEVPRDGAQRLGAADDGGLELAGLDARGEHVDQQLGAVAALHAGAQRGALVDAEQLGDAPAGIAVGPGGRGHDAEGGAAQEGVAHAGVGERRADDLGHQRGGLVGVGGDVVGRAADDLTETDEDGKPGIERHGAQTPIVRERISRMISSVPPPIGPRRASR
jgi:hypothetical protein